MTSLSQPLAKYMGTAINRSLKQIENDLTPRQIGEMLADDPHSLREQYRPKCIELETIYAKLDDDTSAMLNNVINELWFAVCHERCSNK